MNLRIYQVDAFASKVFSGNPAAVCPLEQWLSDELMQNIAMENNLAETAFYRRSGDQYEIRWFTPAVEVDLCGHATLAAAYVLFHHEDHKGNVISFYSPRSGILTVTKEGDFFTLDFPTDVPGEIPLPEELLACFDKKPLQAFKGKTDYMLVFDNEEDIMKITPVLADISRLNARGVIITAPGKEVDFVCRFFAPQCGINEDPVTGSAYTTLTPYWSRVLGKTDLTATQLSQRRGYLRCANREDRVKISGKAQLYMTGEIFLDERKTG